MMIGLITGSLWAQTTPIGSRLELFVDHALIDNMEHTRLKLHHPSKAPRAQSPLPQAAMLTIIKDGELYRAWYRGYDPAYTGDRHSGNPGENVHYAESHDGTEWTFPHLRLHEINGSLENNVILANWAPYLHNFMPFLDSRPDVDPSERYKALAGYPGRGDKRGTTEPGRGLFAFVSPDGIHWTKKQEAIPYRPEWRHAFDSPNISFWSEAEQLYVCYFRTYTLDTRLRSISRTTSLDFEHWSDPVELNTNLPGEHLYTNSTHPYFRAPHIYVAFPRRYVPGRTNPRVENPKNDNVTDVRFMTSRAGSQHYDRTFTEAFIRPGLEPAEWGNRAAFIASSVVPTSDQEMSLYPRNGDRYIMRTDGFISVNAGTHPGELQTKTITFSGQSLVLNYSTSAAGSIRVEIQDQHGQPIPGYSREECEIIYGDTIAGRVRWNESRDLSALAGQSVRLRFFLQEADLYSFRFE